VSAGNVPRAVAEARGWTTAALDRLGVGYDGKRVTFQVRDATGEYGRWSSAIRTRSALIARLSRT
jgi:hypothetical protein